MSKGLAVGRSVRVQIAADLFVGDKSAAAMDRAGRMHRSGVTSRPGDNQEAAPEIIEPVPVSSAPSEFGDDAQCERVAANTGEVFTEQVGGSTDVAGGRRADHFDVMAFPAHRAATGGTWGSLR